MPRASRASPSFCSIRPLSRIRASRCATPCSAAKIPFIELHLSNVAAREDFRHRSFFADIALGTIAGFGVTSYELALEAAIRHLTQNGEK